MSSRMDNGTTIRNSSQEVEEDLIGFGSDDSNNDPVVRNVRKRARGPTHMPKVWARNGEDRVSVKFNEFGQPVDEKTTSELTHFMGTLARSGKYCPVHKPWTKVTKTKKDILLNFLKEKFDLPPGSDVWILKSFGKKVRNWRARIKKDFYDPSMSLREQKQMKPVRVHKNQWRKLVKSWNKEESKKVSEKNKENRAQKKMVPLTGKKSYARVREQLKQSISGREPSRMELFHSYFSKDGTTKTLEAENAIEKMKEMTSQLPEGSIDKPGPQDIYSKVMGDDANGTASMFGLGVRASDVWGPIPSRSACYRKNLELTARCEKLTSQAEHFQSGGSSVHLSPQSPIVANESQPLRVGALVYLKSIINSMEIVAKGWIKSLDPRELVGNEEIGPDWCEVNVQVAVKRDERLVRPYGLFITVHDAIGATVAWPCTFISVVRED